MGLEDGEVIQHSNDRPNLCGTCSEKVEENNFGVRKAFIWSMNDVMNAHVRVGFSKEGRQRIYTGAFKK